MSFPNSAMKRKRNEEKVSSRKVSFKNGVEFPAFSNSKKAAPQCRGMVKGGVVPISPCIEGDWLSGRLVNKVEEEPEKIRFELADTMVSKKSVEQLNWAQRNELMHELFNGRFYGMTKSSAQNWSDDEDNNFPDDGKWYMRDDEEELDE